MRDLTPHKEKNSKHYFLDKFLRNISVVFETILRFFLSMKIEEKKALSLTFVIMTLAFFLGSNDIFLLHHILCMSWEYSKYDG